MGYPNFKSYYNIDHALKNTEQAMAGGHAEVNL